MKRTIMCIATATGALTLAGGLVAATALPAAADGGPANEAYAASASGLINQSPIADATFPGGSSPVTLPFAHIFGLLTTGPINDQADATSASSTVIRADATQLGGQSGGLDLTDYAAASHCSFNGESVSGGAFIFEGKIKGFSGPIQLPFFPAPNTHYSLPYGATVTLNKQTTTDGILTVTAIYATLRGGAGHLAIGVSVCNPADVTPPTPTPTPTSTDS